MHLIGPDMAACMPQRTSGQRARGKRRAGGADAAPTHSMDLPLCATCCARGRRLRVQLHACRYEDAAEAAAEDPDVAVLFHPGFAADQPQEVETPRHSARHGRPAASVQKRQRAGASAVGPPASGAADMPSLRRAWQPCLQRLASLTCPLLITAFSFAGAPPPHTLLRGPARASAAERLWHPPLPVAQTPRIRARPRLMLKMIENECSLMEVCPPQRASCCRPSRCGLPHACPPDPTPACCCCRSPR